VGRRKMQLLYLSTGNCVSSRERNNTICSETQYKKKKHYFWVVTPCDLTDVLYIFWDPEDRLSGFIINTVTVSPTHYMTPHFRTHYSKHSRL
jgi:hypothetical protein